ncbi:hypothetical protein Bca101_092112 [Brassica carinata]
MEMEKYKPVMTLVLLQFTVAGVTLFTKAAFMDGLSPAVFVVYRHAIATLFICPISFFFTWRKASKPSLGVRGFWWVAFTAVIGVTVNQNAYFLQGLTCLLHPWLLPQPILFLPLYQY